MMTAHLPPYPEPEGDAPRHAEHAISVAESLVAFLATIGVQVAYGLVGGSIVPLCDALSRGGFRILHCRHESGAAFAALEESLATNKLVVVFATTGPGLTNSITGLCSARMEGAKVLLLSGGTAPSRRERGASQETTSKTIPLGLFAEGPLFHYATTVEHACQLSSVLHRLAVGANAVEGFVAHIHLPLSVQSTPAKHEPVASFSRLPGPAPSREALLRVSTILTTEACALWVGFGARYAAAEVRALAERLQMPVMCSPRAKGIFPENHPLFLGVTGVGGHARVMSCLRELGIQRTLVLGSRLAECTSFWSPDLAPPGGFLHVDLDASAFGAAYPSTPTLGVIAEIGEFLAALLSSFPTTVVQTQNFSPSVLPEPLTPRPEALVRPRFLFETLQRVVVESSDAMVLTEAGNAFVWGSHVLRFQEPGRYRVGLHFGSMGHATTGVIGAARALGKTAVAIVGDGAMLMLEEVSTAVRYNLPVVWVVLNDRRYGIVEHGMRSSGYEPVETTLPATDFSLMALSLGGRGGRIERESELEEALRLALSAGGPFVLDVQVDPDEHAPITNRFRSLEAQGAMPEKGRSR